MGKIIIGALTQFIGSGSDSFIRDRHYWVVERVKLLRETAVNAVCFTSPSSSSAVKTRAQFAASRARFVSYSVSLPSFDFAAANRHLLCLGTIFFGQRSISDPSSSFSGLSRKARICTALATVDEDAVVATGVNGEENVDRENDEVSSRVEQEPKQLGTPCEIYVCNLPRSCDEKKILEMFRPYGTVVSVEVCRNTETGESRGCGYSQWHQ
ncbi:hypothetical protein L6164_021292 [Bauhinia variegata]|uniref:Uncharacterized protein n=1 Tax=Bauhinia variegata TaxID=167791 RepID=A0ACB9MZC6_BAUVA|nr:hypothetical protein L6164_021292 [Bauhinia variegata]